MSLEYKKIICSLILLLMFIVFTIIVKHYFKPFFLIITIIFLCYPIYSLLCNSNLFNNRVNALISIIFVNSIFFIIVLFIGNFAYKQVNLFTNGFENLAFTIEYKLQDLSNITNINLTDLSDNIIKSYKNVMNSSFLRRGAAYTTDSLFAYFVGNMAAYFILADKYVIVNHATALISEAKVSIIKAKLEDINKMFKIEIILVLITTIETIIGFMILGLNNFVCLGITCGILDLLPYIGTMMVFLPLIFYKIYVKEYILAFGFICLYILLIINRQVMETKFMSDRLEVHPLFIILSLYIGVKIFGFIGLFMGPLYIIIVKEILKY